MPLYSGPLGIEARNLPPVTPRRTDRQVEAHGLKPRERSNGPALPGATGRLKTEPHAFYRQTGVGAAECLRSAPSKGVRSAERSVAKSWTVALGP